MWYSWEMFMNVNSGSVCTYVEWLEDFIDAKEREALDEEGWMEPFEANIRKDGLVHVKWSNKSMAWEEVE